MRALWSDRPNCSHNVSQKVKRIRRIFLIVPKVEEGKSGCPGPTYALWEELQRRSFAWPSLTKCFVTWKTGKGGDRAWCNVNFHHFSAQRCFSLSSHLRTFVVPKPQKLAEMKFQNFNYKTWGDKLGGILGEDFWVILHSNWSTKMRRKFRPILRPILRPDLRPSHKNLSSQFRSGESLVI